MRTNKPDIGATACSVKYGSLQDCPRTLSLRAVLMLYPRAFVRIRAHP
jgi:hypothetical protein